MTAADIISLLQQVPPETLVVQSMDPEGNSFSPVFCVEKIDYLAESEFRGDIWGPEENDPKRPEGVVDAVCFWPSS